MTLKMQMATNMVVNIDMPHLEKLQIELMISSFYLSYNLR